MALLIGCSTFSSWLTPTCTNTIRFKSYGSLALRKQQYDYSIALRKMQEYI
ncbi:MAG TPA: hypothetical protein VEV62_08005 [Parafilimonas sp.]|nr:hypothetical protein [Parafilimonas sp.]